LLPVYVLLGDIILDSKLKPNNKNYTLLLFGNSYPCFVLVLPFKGGSFLKGCRGKPSLFMEMKL